MAGTTNIDESSSSGEVKFKTWVLKVSIHCEGCKRKVIKLLSCVEGVYKLDVDLKQQSVMVTGNVEADTLINKLVKSGRNAELWCQISNQKMQSKKSGNNKKTVDLPTGERKIVVGDEKEKLDMGKSDAAQDACKVGSESPATAERREGGGDEGAAAKVNQAGDITAGSGGEVEAVKEEKMVGNKPEVGSESNRPPSAKATNESSQSESGDGKVSKKKKKKGQNGNCINNNNNLLGAQKGQDESSVDAGPQNNNTVVTPARANNMPPRQHLQNKHVPPPSSPPVYVMSYNMASTAPSYTTSYYASPTPAPPHHEYRYQEQERVAPPSDQEWYPRQPLDSFEMFSDENPNGCSIM